ncbi:MAG: hypothetical protein AAF800_01440 [Planctomycetota bacterium]
MYVLIRHNDHGIMESRRVHLGCRTNGRMYFRNCEFDSNVSTLMDNALSNMGLRIINEVQPVKELVSPLLRYQSDITKESAWPTNDAAQTGPAPLER